MILKLTLVSNEENILNLKNEDVYVNPAHILYFRKESWLEEKSKTTPSKYREHTVIHLTNGETLVVKQNPLVIAHELQKGT